LNSDDNCVRSAGCVDHGQSGKARTGRLDQALALVPSSVPAQAHIRGHDSDAHALIEAAEATWLEASEALEGIAA